MIMKTTGWAVIAMLICLAPATANEPPRVDINSASVVQLSENLPGIGPTKAQRIVDWRNHNGAFDRVDDLLNVKGIGPKTLERLRALIVLETSAESRQSARKQQKRESAARLGVRKIIATARQAAIEAGGSESRDTASSGGQ